MSTRGRSLRRSSSTGRRSDTIDVRLRSLPRSVVIGLVRHPYATSSTSTHVAYSPCCYGRCGACVCDGLTACKNAESVFDRTLFATCLIGVSQRRRYRWRATGKRWPGLENPWQCVRCMRLPVGVTQCGAGGQFVCRLWRAERGGLVPAGLVRTVPVFEPRLRPPPLRGGCRLSCTEPLP